MKLRLQINYTNRPKKSSRFPRESIRPKTSWINTTELNYCLKIESEQILILITWLKMKKKNIFLDTFSVYSNNYYMYVIEPICMKF